MGNPIKMVESIPTDPKVKNYMKLEWSLVYSKENGVLLLIFAKSEGKGNWSHGKCSHMEGYVMWTTKIASLPTFYLMLKAREEFDGC